MMFPARRVFAISMVGASTVCVGAGLSGGHAQAQGPIERVVHADVVALDQIIVYNRFGSFDPYGMVFALRRDVSATYGDGSGQPYLKAAECQQATGAEAGDGAELNPGQVRLKDCKRPRPLVLRANVGDILDVTFTNLLRTAQPDVSQTFCQVPPANRRDPEMRAERHNARDICNTPPEAPEGGGAGATRLSADWPATRLLSLAMPGLRPLPADGRAGKGPIDPACLGQDAVAPGESFHCRFKLEAEGTHLFSNPASASGGEGDGGSLTHGLFGAVIVEPAGAKAYRSQMSQTAFDAVWAPNASAAPHVRQGNLVLDKDVADNEAATRLDETSKWNPCRAAAPGQPAATRVPIALMHRDCAADGGAVEIVHGDLNAVIHVTDGDAAKMEGETARPFREFVTIFHDELKTYYTNAFDELGKLGPLSGIRDGFGINYGSSGVGSLAIANRKKIGPAADCVECLYEEFFLESWANGDPALLESYPDDPSNVHHSYLNDRVVFRNFHAGPKETHVFHLHSHQWYAGNDWNRGAYLDSQTIGPQQGFSYWIYQGGLDRYAKDTAKKGLGYWASLGSGNRNRTPGDAIFHCHLYPHFAQGMWELWRVHDVLEDGTRTLPDGQLKEQLSLWMEPDADVAKRRPGTDPATGPTRQYGVEGTPIAALLPVPGQPAPLVPTYGDKGMPGYPFYIAGTAGRRAPQAPLDIAGALTPEEKAANAGRDFLDGGLPRHTIDSGERTVGGELASNVAEAVALGDMTAEFDHLKLKLLPYEGTDLEKRAMAFHHNGKIGAEELTLRTALGEDAHYDAAPEGKMIGYQSVAIGLTGIVSPKSSNSPFMVNGAPAKPGAPFADPCGAPDALKGTELPTSFYPGARSVVWSGSDKFVFGHPDFVSGGSGADPTQFTADPAMTAFRRFEVSAVQLDMVVNRAGWHDPQSRINVLSAFSDKWKGKKRGDAEPFFFRAFSGECIEFRHTNELPKDLERDDFQMKVPTDTIGQHIHLVKFDVTSSDGSGNGWNYEDGTFSPDEVLDRLCKSQAAGGGVDASEAPGVSINLDAARQAMCADKTKHPSSEPLQTHRSWFQTTTQRWFADPILSATGEARKPDGTPDAYAGPYADRTMRTVFTHDHFGPSNIQQHGFYSALLIEPASKEACTYTGPQFATGGVVAEGKPPLSDRASCISPKPSGELTDATESGKGVGSNARVADRGAAAKDVYHPDYREFALSIADFALLYDGNSSSAFEDDWRKARGLDRIANEALGTITPEMGAHPEEEPEASIPARYEHPSFFAWSVRPDWIEARGHEIKAAAIDLHTAYGRPVYPPLRPEAISQQHHDPYLVNYRNEPIPLRVGQTVAATSSFLLPAASTSMLEGKCNDLANARAFNHNDVKFQRMGSGGDMANVFRSSVHGDPCTPVLDALSGERIMFRLIQGAQEVQHVFTVEGRAFRRNVDQYYGYASHWQDETAAPTRWRACWEKAKAGLPHEYEDWLYNNGAIPAADRPYWQRFEKLIAACNNIEGYVTAQEIGISEHFEMTGPFSSRGNTAPEAITASNAGSAEDLGKRPRDVLFNFGSIDAQWNGAWGMLRISTNEASPDLTSCLAGQSPADPAASDAAVRNCLTADDVASLGASQATARLSSVAPKLLVKEAAPTGAFNLRAPRDVACPIVGGQKARESYLALAAVAVRDVVPFGGPTPEGTIYAKGVRNGALYDPDGLMFVPLEIGKVRVFTGVGSGTRAMTASDILENQAVAADDDPTAGRPQLDRASLIEAIRAQLSSSGVHPLVLRMNAGECLNVAVINALREVNSPNRRAGLLDRPGDATMPKIVPLNVDAEQALAEADGIGATDLVPSASLALSTPVSITTGSDFLPSPIGVNLRGALEPAKGGRANWHAMAIYGGRMWLPEEEMNAALAPQNAPTLEESVIALQLVRGGQFVKLNIGFEPLEESVCGPSSYYYSVFGSPYCISKAPGSDLAGNLPDLWTTGIGSDIGEALDKAVQARLEEKGAIKAIPYAYGALPIKSIGDPIGHGPHGLAGTLIIEPAGTTYLGSSTATSEAVTMNLAKSDELGLPAATVREQSYLWQDGLNLWDRRAVTLSGYGLSGRPVPDCEICDDSYDRGEKGFSYRSDPLFFRLRKTHPLGDKLGPAGLKIGATEVYSENSNLNGFAWPRNVFTSAYAPINTPEIRAAPNQEVWVRIVAAPGRARQRSFVPAGAGYQDIMPGFGSGHSTLLAPGKAATAALLMPSTPRVCALAFDGPRQILGGGSWTRLCTTN